MLKALLVPIRCSATSHKDKKENSDGDDKNPSNSRSCNILAKFSNHCTAKSGDRV